MNYSTYKLKGTYITTAVLLIDYFGRDIMFILIVHKKSLDDNTDDDDVVV